MPHARHRLNRSVRRYAHFTASTRSDLYERGEGRLDGGAFYGAIWINALAIAIKDLNYRRWCDREVA